jgi:electron transfer flavoprotein alpha/beta subunit
VSSPAHAWLAQWRAAVPPSLASAVEPAVTASGDSASDIVTALSDAALACLRTALRIGNDRAAALHLLAADALITAACEAAAGSSGQLDDLAKRFAADRLGTLFQEELASEHS